jgi:PqqD family protein of HPr-rel-A system
MATARASRFRTRAGPPFEWRAWGDHTVLFDVVSGDTHVLDLVARQGLTCLAETPLDAPALTSAMAGTLDVRDDEALNAYIDRLLVELETLGLIEAVDA